MPPGDLTTVILGPWIGLDDRLESGVLRWRDGCILKDGEFAKWAPNEPKLKSKTQSKLLFFYSVCVQTKYLMIFFSKIVLFVIYPTI